MAFFSFTQTAETLIEPTYWRTALIYGAVVFLIVFVFQAIALYTVATRNGIANKWMAFVPVLSTYYIGVCARKNKPLGFDSKVVGIVIAVLELLLCAGFILHYVGHYFAEPYIQIVSQQDYYGLPIYEVSIPNIDPELAWAGFCYLTLGDILYWISLLYSIVEILLISAFFQTYAPRRYFIFTIVSIFLPVAQGILFFAVRNNKGMNYREYLMREQERQYRIYRQNRQNDPYGQNYYGHNNYNQSNYGYNEQPRPETKNEDPFEEFGKSDDDPFNH
ncbi:MAG: hypothetical protein J1G07_01240 [Clostridiales bacterium]|nr:hypothetical protein [Clostridiales bacterium]